MADAPQSPNSSSNARRDRLIERLQKRTATVEGGEGAKANRTAQQQQKTLARMPVAKRKRLHNPSFPSQDNASSLAAIGLSLVVMSNNRNAATCEGRGDDEEEYSLSLLAPFADCVDMLTRLTVVANCITSENMIHFSDFRRVEAYTEKELVEARSCAASNDGGSATVYDSIYAAAQRNTAVAHQVSSDFLRRIERIALCESVVVAAPTMEEAASATPTDEGQVAAANDDNLPERTKAVALMSGTEIAVVDQDSWGSILSARRFTKENLTDILPHPEVNGRELFICGNMMVNGVRHGFVRVVDVTNSLCKDLWTLPCPIHPAGFHPVRMFVCDIPSSSSTVGADNNQTAIDDDANSSNSSSLGSRRSSFQGSVEDFHHHHATDHPFGRNANQRHLVIVDEVPKHFRLWAIPFSKLSSKEGRTKSEDFVSTLTPLPKELRMLYPTRGFRDRSTMETEFAAPLAFLNPSAGLVFVRLHYDAEAVNAAEKSRRSAEKRRQQEGDNDDDGNDAAVAKKKKPSSRHPPTEQELLKAEEDEARDEFNRLYLERAGADAAPLQKVLQWTDRSPIDAALPRFEAFLAGYDVDSIDRINEGEMVVRPIEDYLEYSLLFSSSPRADAAAAQNLVRPWYNPKRAKASLTVPLPRFL